MLGLMHLITLGVDVAQCFESELVFMPVLHFIFVFSIMHFILTQVSLTTVVRTLATKILMSNLDCLDYSWKAEL